jgi:ribose/xylose/arabinose/galactoside ABC-type transport system permease subunit
MEILFEFLFELVLEGSFALFSEKKVPMWLRILAALVVLAFFGGIVGLIIYGGITTKNPLVVGIGVFIAIIGIIAFLHAWNKHEGEA